MHMRRLALSILFLAAVPASASNWGDGHRGLSISTDDDARVTDCSQIRVRYNGRNIPMISEDVAVRGARSLKIASESNGGIYVSGGSAFSVKACKASVFNDAQTLRVSVNGNEVSGNAEENGDVIYFIVQTPRGGELSLQSHNGPISIREVDGSVTARAQNGPIALKDSTGDLDMGTQNGPIAFAGNGGNVKLHATNGPISIHLQGSGWERGSLDAETQNGPLALKLPRFYHSGVSVDSNGNAPVSCHAEGCAAAIRAMSKDGDDDDFRWPRHIDLGSGAKVISVQTHNGPIAIKESD
jgi:hypothetical protein